MRARRLARRLALAVAAAATLTGVPATAHASVAIGIAGDPAKVGALKAQGLPVSIRATFEAWSLDRTPDGALSAAQTLGMQPMITWEPWTPTPSGSRKKVQAQFSNRAIAAGKNDKYIRRFARSLKHVNGPVYLRYAHEMNGTWYPWSSQASDYPRAWRHVWKIFRQEKATNVKFVWSPNLNTFQTDAQFKAGLARYWPGGRYVDYVGSSLIRFRTQGAQGLQWSMDRLEQLRTYNRPILLSEVKVDLEEAPQWTHDLRCSVLERPWIMGVIWSETPSRLAARDPRVGNMNWSLSDQPALRAELTGLATGAAC